MLVDCYFPINWAHKTKKRQERPFCCIMEMKKIGTQVAISIIGDLNIGGLK